MERFSATPHRTCGRCHVTEEELAGLSEPITHPFSRTPPPPPHVPKSHELPTSSAWLWLAVNALSKWSQLQGLEYRTWGYYCQAPTLHGVHGCDENKSVTARAPREEMKVNKKRTGESFVIPSPWIFIRKNVSKYQKQTFAHRPSDLSTSLEHVAD
ncbi:hypothetical protein CEXT_547331 [Caerostris extrusa]|uniref:Uncharacterized protein n=1 Tax=Caerostris extrusa TaxID=172846 RepID=A0AAV4WEX4_CAEEX|nr:hypothetical protein CEXT_547331 [Caerostris extrusa]